MGSPIPLSGSNPYTGMYQNRQFGVGSPYSPTANHQVSGYLANPPADLLTAEEQTPLVQQAEFWGLYVQTVTITGSPTGGTFALQYGVNFTDPLPHNISAANLQTALQGLTSIGSGNVTVTGNDGGPFTVTLGGTFANKPVQLISLRNNQLTGGTLASVKIFSTAQQQGISPF